MYVPGMGGYLAYWGPRISLAGLGCGCVGAALVRPTPLFEGCRQASEQNRSMQLWTALFPHTAFEDGAGGADE